MGSLPKVKRDNRKRELVENINLSGIESIVKMRERAEDDPDIAFKKWEAEQASRIS